MNRSSSHSTKASPSASKRGKTPNNNALTSGNSGSSNLLIGAGTQHQLHNQGYQIFISPNAQAILSNQGNTPNSQNNNGRRQDGQELRQRIQNLLSQHHHQQQTNSNSTSPVNAANTGLNNRQHLHTYDGSKVTQPPAGQRQQFVQSPLFQNNIESDQLSDNNNNNLSNRQNNNKRGVLAGQKNSFQQTMQPQPILQRLLSDDQQPQKLSTQALQQQQTINDHQPSSSTRGIKLGFQENLMHSNVVGGSRRAGVNAIMPGHHQHQRQGLGGTGGAGGGSGSGMGMTSSSNILNKAALVTIMSSNNHITTSDSSKFNSQVLAFRGSLWLPPSILIPSTQQVKSKRVQEIIQIKAKSCHFCNTGGTGGRQQSSQEQSLNKHQTSNKQLQHSSHLFYQLQHAQMAQYHDQLRGLVRETLDKKYLTSQDYYNSRIVSDIMYNENRHIVSVFKDYLIFDDFSEYLKRFYRDHEAVERLPKVFEFYEKYSKVFPNYVALPGESKYMFKNIERKQKLIDEKHQQLLEKQERIKQDQEEAKALGVALDSSVIQRMRMSKNVIFGSQFINDLTDLQQQQSILNDEKDGGGNENNSQILRKQSSKILDMLHTIQSNAPNYQHTPVINQFLKQANLHHHNQSSRQQTLPQGSGSTMENQGNLQPGGLEYLINQLHQFDNRNDSSVFYGKHPNGAKTQHDPVFMADISLSSSQGMSSFLQDFDLREGGIAGFEGVGSIEDHSRIQTSSHNTLKEGVFDMNNYRTQQQQQQKAQLLLHEENNFFIFDETSSRYVRGTSGGSHGSGGDDKRLSNLGGASQIINHHAYQTQNTASRKSLLQMDNSSKQQVVPSMQHVKTTASQKSQQSNRSKMVQNTAANNSKGSKNATGSKQGQKIATSGSGWSNILLSAQQKKSGQQQEVTRKVTAQNLGGNIILSSAVVSSYQKSNLTQQAAQALLAQTKKQPTPKNRGKGLVINAQVANNATSVTPTATSMGGISPPSNQQLLLMQQQPQSQLSRPVTGTTKLGQIVQHQDQILAQQYQTLQPNLVANSAQSQYQASVGRSSQVSLGSPLSIHSVQGSLGGGMPMMISPQPHLTAGSMLSQGATQYLSGSVSNSNKASQVTKGGQSTAAMNLISQMPSGSTLKQLATAAAKANLQSQQVQKKTSGRGLGVGVSQTNAQSTIVKPNIQITLQHQAPVQTTMPRSGPNTKGSGDLVHLTPTSLNAAISAGLLGSVGNSQSSMRVSPELAMIPNNMLMTSTPGAPITKKVTETSKSFKVVQSSSSGIMTQTPSQTTSKAQLNPTSISQSIKDAVSKLLPPQPKFLQMSASTHIQPSLKQSMKSGGSGIGPSEGMVMQQHTPTSNSSSVSHPQQLMSNTAALFSKLFITQQQQNSQQPVYQDLSPSAASQHQPVYSTRGPQKKNFSSPDDLQVRIAARKNQHQQLAIATAQNALGIRKGINEFDGNNAHGATNNTGKQKMLIVLKNGGTSSTTGPQSKSNSKSPQQTKQQKGVLNTQLSRAGGTRGAGVPTVVINDDDHLFQEAPQVPQSQSTKVAASRGVREEYLEEDEYEEEDEMDERNDVYTAKGGQGLAVPVTAKSHSSIRGGGRQLTSSELQQQQVRNHQVQSATAQSSVNSYNFKMPPSSMHLAAGSLQQNNQLSNSKRNPSNTSDKSHTSSMKSNYSSNNNNPYQRVLSSFSTGTKKKVKVALLDNQQLEPSSNAAAAFGAGSAASGSIGSKLYEKIKSGMQAALGGGSQQQNLLLQSTEQQQPKASTPITQKGGSSGIGGGSSAVGKKKPSTIFTFNK